MNASEHLAGAAALTDLQGRVTYWSPAMEARLGWLQVEAVGRPLPEFFVDAAVIGAAKGSPLWDSTRETVGPCAIRRKGGGNLDAWLSIIPLREERGEVYGFAAVLKGERPANGSGDLAASSPASPSLNMDRKAIHEFNNLLTSIHSCIDLSLREELPERAAQFLTNAQSSAFRAAQLANTFRSAALEVAGRAAVANPAGEETPVTGHTQTPLPTAGGTERILIAEDDNSTRLLMKAILGYRGYRIVDAANGGDAWARCEESPVPFDLAILDINMPELDGREVYGRIRLKWKQCAILFLSGSAEEFPSVSPDEGGMVECLTKPFGNKDLLEVVRRLLDRRSGKV